MHKQVPLKHLVYMYLFVCGWTLNFDGAVLGTFDHRGVSSETNSQHTVAQYTGAVNQRLLLLLAAIL